MLWVEDCHRKWGRPYWLSASFYSSFSFTVFMCFFLSWSVDSKNITQGPEERQRQKIGRESAKEEGRRELRELIILFNHILDEVQVVCGTESETERDEWGQECEGDSKSGRGGRQKERDGGINGKRGREKMRRGLMERGREEMSLRAEPLETARSAAALKQVCTYANSYYVYVCVRRGEWQPFP